jgi:hypothetical protein
MRLTRFGLGWLLATAVLLFGACDDGMPTAPGNGSATVTLAIGETLAVPNTSLSLRFVAVSSDSRCPIDAICIQLGEAVLELEALTSGAASRFKLSTTGDARVAQIGDYRVQLASVLPARRASTPIVPADYRATVQVDTR